MANFGSPEGATTLFLTRKITQIQDNLTRATGTHVVKFGGGFNLYDYTEQAVVFARYTFPSIDAYIAARNGTNPRSYTSYAETFGDPVSRYRATFWNLFVQDDWKLSRRLKLNYGLRYDLYRIPEAVSTSPFSASQEFSVDKNNFAPRLGSSMPCAKEIARQLFGPERGFITTQRFWRCISGLCKTTVMRNFSISVLVEIPT